MFDAFFCTMFIQQDSRVDQCQQNIIPSDVNASENCWLLFCSNTLLSIPVFTGMSYFVSVISRLKRFSKKVVMAKINTIN